MEGGGGITAKKKKQTTEREKKAGERTQQCKKIIILKNCKICSFSHSEMVSSEQAKQPSRDWSKELM